MMCRAAPASRVPRRLATRRSALGARRSALGARPEDLRLKPSGPPTRVSQRPNGRRRRRARCRRRATGAPAGGGTRATRRRSEHRRSADPMRWPGTAAMSFRTIREAMPRRREPESVQIEKVGVADTVGEEARHPDESVVDSGESDVLGLLDGTSKCVGAAPVVEVVPLQALLRLGPVGPGERVVDSPSRRSSCRRPPSRETEMRRAAPGRSEMVMCLAGGTGVVSAGVGSTRCVRRLPWPGEDVAKMVPRSSSRGRRGSPRPVRVGRWGARW